VEELLSIEERELLGKIRKTLQERIGPVLNENIEKTTFPRQEIVDMY